MKARFLLLFKNYWHTHSALILLGGLLMLAAPSGFAQNVTISTDKDDYWPGEWVIITGEGWQGDDSVKITLEHIEPNIPAHTHESWYLKPDVNGQIYDEWFVMEEELGTTFHLMALGVPSGRFAENWFTDGTTVIFTVGSQTGTVTAGTGGTVTYNINAQRDGASNAFTTTLTTSTLPTGVTASFSPNSLSFSKDPSTTLTSVLTLTISTTANAGTYSFTISGSGGGTSGSITLVIGGCTNPAAPISGGNQTICASQLIPALTVSVGDGETADWYAAPSEGTALETGTLSYTPSTAGTYYAEARNSTTGCKSTTRTAVTLTVNPLPTVNAGTYAAVCIDAADVELAGTPAGGTWSGTGVTGNLFDPSVGTQTLTYTYTDGNGCTNSAQTTITVNPLPTVNAGTYAAVCIDAADVELAGTPAGGTWSGTGVSGTSFDPSVGTQTLTYTYTDGNGCTNSAQTTITVNPLPVAGDITGDHSVCLNGSLSLTAHAIGTGALTYNWSSSNTGIATVDHSGNVTPVTSGTTNITYTVTDGSSTQCQATSAPFAVTVKDLPNNSTFSGNTICLGQQGQLTFDAINTTFVTPYTIEYTDGVTTWTQEITTDGSTQFNVAVNPTATTNYTLVSITNGNGCKRTTGITDANAQITVRPLPTVICPANITVNNSPGLCSASVTFAATATGTPAPAIKYYIGATEISSPYIFPVGTTTVNVSATNTCGTANCSFTVTVNDNEAPKLTSLKFPGTSGTNACKTDAVTAAPFSATDATQGYTDNCSSSVIVELTDTEVTGTDCNWTVTYTFSVKDEKNNVLTGQTYSNT
ncbi:MAG TPA: Ig-like domain-containing protein, partial [Prolixibacteraceae bacterium]|nr:Ig-like domain-containing protein [Prolixibacteraceae bacterium]